MRWIIEAITGASGFEYGDYLGYVGEPADYLLYFF